MTCNKNCGNIDLFPLKKNCGLSAGSTGPTGPAGKQGQQGPAGASGSSYTNFLYIQGTVDRGFIGPQSLPFGEETPIQFENDDTNSGNWSFIQGQSSFTVPEAGTYKITFDPNIQFQPIGATTTTLPVIQSLINIAGTAQSTKIISEAFTSVSTFLPPETRTLHNELIWTLNGEEDINFSIVIGQELGTNISSYRATVLTSATIHRIN